MMSRDAVSEPPQFGARNGIALIAAQVVDVLGRLGPLPVSEIRLELKATSPRGIEKALSAGV